MESGYGNANQMWMEASANYNSNNGTLAIYSDNTPELNFNVQTSAGYTTNTFPTGSFLSGFHDYLLVLKTNAAGLAWVDGTSRTVSSSVSGSGTFSTQTLYLMARNAASIYTGGTLAQVAIWKTALTGTDATALHGGTNPCAYKLTNLVACWPFNGVSPETDASGNGHSLTLLGSPVLLSSASASSWLNSNCSPNSSGTGIAFSNWTAGDGGASGSKSTTLGTNPTVGDYLLVGSLWDPQSINITSIGDNHGGVYNALACTSSPQNFGADKRMQLWLIKVTATGTYTVTINYSGTTTDTSVLDIEEISGLNSSNPYDVCSITAVNAVLSDTEVSFAGPAPLTNYHNEAIVQASFADGANANWSAGSCMTGIANEAQSFWQYRLVGQQYQPYGWVNGGNPNGIDWSSAIIGLKAATQ